MSIEKSRPFVVGLDGLHRAGKGTQANLLLSEVLKRKGTGVVLRGDGTREGLGLSEGDPYSEEWQARSRHVKSPEGNTVEAWNAASYILMRELNERRKKDPPDDVLIVDRTILSRAAFLLHRGMALEGERLSLDELYPDNMDDKHGTLDIPNVLPDIIFELRVSSPAVLLDRLDGEDPKYTFRARNIRGGFYPASIARAHLPSELERRVVSLDAMQDVEVIHSRIKSVLAKTALSNFLKL